MKSMKTVCEMFAKIPQDIVGNTSITKVSHKDKTDKSVGGGYTPASGAIGMTGRPKIAEQKFGSALSKTKDGKPIGELPGKIDPDCQPANEKKVDFLAFAAAHEVGHGVDDSKSFMAKNGGKAGVRRLDRARRRHAGRWPTSSARTSSSTPRPSRRNTCSRRCSASRRPTPPVPDGARRLGQGEAGLRRLVRDREQRQPVVEPVEVATRSPSAGASTSRPTRATGSATMPRRASKGLTGYQFRAPGEWFAELYAGYRSGKLGKKHPALEWLTKL